MIRKKQLVSLVALAVVAVFAFESLDASDADARKKKRRPPPPAPPANNIVFCPAGTTCEGTPGADVMVGASGGEDLRGHEGNDTYVGSEGCPPFECLDRFNDGSSTSNDLYGGFYNGEFRGESITDRGGVDKLDLSMSTSAYASTDFEFIQEGTNDEHLRIREKNLDGLNGDDVILVINHFSTAPAPFLGRIEYFKFSDVTFSWANLPVQQES